MKTPTSAGHAGVGETTKPEFRALPSSTPLASAPQQFSLFPSSTPLTAPSTNPIVGLTVWLDGAPGCRRNLAVIGSSRGPHEHELRCLDCGSHVSWLALSIAAFVREEMRVFGRPTEPIRITSISNSNQGEPAMSGDKFDNKNTGALFKVAEADKKATGSPDYRGSINAAGLDYWVSAWIRTSKKGEKYMSLAIKPKAEQSPAKPAGNSIPF